MDKKELQKRLNKPYSTQNWQEVIQFVFPNVQILNPPQIIPIKNDKVEVFRQIGNVQLNDGKMLALFELKLKSNVNIIRNRVELNNLVSQYIDQDQTHGVLSIFEQGNDDYRFTFSARASEFDEDVSDFEIRKTDTKRFTYVLGKNESCKTPAQRFFTLSEQKEKADIKSVEEAFSVEKLSKQFFEEYKKIYLDFIEFLSGKRILKESGKWVEKTIKAPDFQFKSVFDEDNLAARNFIKILLGRIVFIKFVQKKGWMGVAPMSTKWENGDHRFIENAFMSFEQKDLFYSLFLNPLFEALNETNRTNNIFKLTNNKVPFLSGGLFDIDNPKTCSINFPAELFENLFSFLDKYNFTIDENDFENDQEIGIDPEMLGHIFENLLEDNKDKGAFYTPKEIVRFMCQESLQRYLKTSLQKNNEWPIDILKRKENEEALYNFVAKKDASGIIEFAKTIASALKKVKICDPAIGSGAFPMGLLNEIFQLIHELYTFKKDIVEKTWGLKGWQPNIVKQNIIQNSIYGVDIEKGAVDIARLRFWLSLIVDEPEPKALPHLDYKIVVGNSLISLFEDTVLKIDWHSNESQTDLFGNSNIEKQNLILQNISDKQRQVFEPSSNEEVLSLEIRDLKIDLLLNRLEYVIKTQGLLTKPTANNKVAKAQTDLWRKTVTWQNQIITLKSIKKDKDAHLNFFDWKLDFPEIMNEQVAKDVGFDIVIGNPPYIQLQKDNGYLAKLLENQEYETFQKTGDIYTLFYEKGYQLLKEEGQLIFITSNKWMRASYGESLRKFISEKANPVLLVDFSGQKIFETATVDVNILLFSKAKNEGKTSACMVKEKCTNNMSVYIRQNNSECAFDSSDSWVVMSPIELQIKRKIEEMGTPLKEWDIHIYRGILTGFNEAFIIDGRKKDELIAADPKSGDIIRPILRGRDIKRYYYDYADLFIIATFPSLKIDIEKYPSVKQHLMSFGYDRLKQTGEIGARKKTGNKWFETQDSISYWDDFSKQKIVWGNLNLRASYSFAKEDIYINAPCPLIVPASKYLLAILNSKLADYYVRSLGVTRSGGYFEYKPMFIEKLPVPIISQKEQLKFDILVNERTESDNLSIHHVQERMIDELVYNLYNLTEEEIGFIESL